MIKITEMIAKLKNDPFYFKSIPEELRKNKRFCLLALEINPIIYSYDSFQLKEDIHIINYLLKTPDNIILLHYHLKQLKFDKNKIKTDVEYAKTYNIYKSLMNKYAYLALYAFFTNTKILSFYNYNNVINNISEEFITNILDIFNQLTEDMDRDLLTRYFGFKNEQSCPYIEYSRLEELQRINEKTKLQNQLITLKRKAKFPKNMERIMLYANKIIGPLPTFEYCNTNRRTK